MDFIKRNPIPVVVTFLVGAVVGAIFIPRTIGKLWSKVKAAPVVGNVAAKAEQKLGGK